MPLTLKASETKIVKFANSISWAGQSAGFLKKCDFCFTFSSCGLGWKLLTWVCCFFLRKFINQSQYFPCQNCIKAQAALGKHRFVHMWCQFDGQRGNKSVSNINDRMELYCYCNWYQPGMTLEMKPGNVIFVLFL